MSKSPVSELRDPSLQSTLEASLVVEHLNGGTSPARFTSNAWTILPYSLIGQSFQGPIEVELEGAPRVRQPRGAGYIIPEGVRHRFGPIDRKDRDYYWSHVRFRVLGEVNLFHFIACPGAVAPSIGREIGRLNRALARLLTDTKTPLINQIAERRRLLSELLALIVRHSAPRPRAWQTLALVSRFVPVLKFMRDHLARPILRDELTDLADLSPSRFHSLFLAATGLPPQQFLIRLRLRAAQEQLISTQRSIHEIAESVGFRDAFHFSRMFKRFTGSSPRLYRQRVLESISASH